VARAAPGFAGGARGHRAGRRFPHDRITGWRTRWSGPVAALLCAGYVYYIGLAFWRR
jgi:hypothetical protein